MQDQDSNSRREFLKKLGLVLGCQYFLDEQVLAAPVKKPGAKKNTSVPMSPAKAPGQATNYKLKPWTGDNFTLGHRLRLNDLPKFPAKPEKTVDFVIVGGGVSGLTAAYQLKDHDFLLLEQYADLGGHARGSSYHGIDYSYGAAYCGPIDDIYGELYSAIGIEPVPLTADRNSFRWNNEWIVGTEGDGSKSLHKEFKKLLEECKPIWEALPPEMEPEKLNTEALNKLDQTLMVQCLQGYSKEFIQLIDSFCKSSLNGNLQQLSGLAGYGLLADLVHTTHVFKGGNPAIARGLAKKVEAAGSNRCIKNCFVWNIEMKDGGASILYTTADGTTHRVDCKHVIVATSPLVASRQLKHIPDQTKAKLMSFRFGSYLVANVCMKEKLFNGSYDCFAGPPYSFADITVAETPYMKTNTYNPSMGSVLTIYQPYSAGSEGRMILMQGDAPKIASSITTQLDKLIPGALKQIEEVTLTRWGHALAIIGPGYFARLAGLQNLPDAPYSLAHSSVWGWPAVESAIRGGRLSAQRVLSKTKSISMLVP